MGMNFNDPVVGGTSLVRASIHSPDYQAGTAGWTINRDGTAEFNNATIRGTLDIGDVTNNQYILIGEQVPTPIQTFTDSIVGTVHVIAALIFYVGTSNDFYFEGVATLPDFGGGTNAVKGVCLSGNPTLTEYYRGFASTATAAIVGYEAESFQWSITGGGASGATKFESDLSETQRNFTIDQSYADGSNPVTGQVWADTTTFTKPNGVEAGTPFHNLVGTDFGVYWPTAGELVATASTTPVLIPGSAQLSRLIPHRWYIVRYHFSAFSTVANDAWRLEVYYGPNGNTTDTFLTGTSNLQVASTASSQQAFDGAILFKTDATDYSATNNQLSLAALRIRGTGTVSVRTYSSNRVSWYRLEDAGNAADTSYFVAGN